MISRHLFLYDVSISVAFFQNFFLLTYYVPMLSTGLPQCRAIAPYPQRSPQSKDFWRYKFTIHPAFAIVLIDCLHIGTFQQEVGCSVAPV